MEFGAMQCVPKNPDCTKCPLNTSCKALQANKVDVLPMKKGKTKVRNRFFNYLVPITTKGRTVLKQRTEKGIWRQLWEFPLLETTEKVELEAIERGISDVIPLNDVSKIYRYNETAIVHKLSHQHLHTTFWIVETSDELTNGITLSELEKYPVPVLMADFFREFKTGSLYV